MTREDKQLLLKDLSARLTYGVKVKVLIHDYDPTSEEILTLNGYNGNSQYTFWLYDNNILPKYGCIGRGFNICEVKPYLRPMSSMTEEEKQELIKEFWGSHTISDSIEEVDWYLKKHFDIRGLIEKGLATEVTKDNNPYKD